MREFPKARPAGPRGYVIDDRQRCKWATVSPEMSVYHDEEWGVSPADDDGYFESLTLEIFEAGLNWTLIFNKRDAFRSAFDGFAVGAVAEYSDGDVERIMASSGIVRNRRKIVASIANAQRFRELQTENGSFRNWLEGLEGDEPALIAELRKQFKFAGPSVARSFLHDVGRTPEHHSPDCWKAVA